LVNCPNCDHPVPDNQRFCGNCGADVRAASPAATPGAPIGEGQSAPYAYSQPSGYGYEPQPAAEPARPAGRIIVIIAVLVLAACCAFMCGTLFGFELSPMLFPSSTPAPTPRVSPTREGLLPIIYLLGMM